MAVYVSPNIQESNTQGMMSPKATELEGQKLKENPCLSVSKKKKMLWTDTYIP